MTNSTSPAFASALPGALTGLRVLDLSRVLAGPWATQMLGDLGADVVKVERPGCGDDTRAWGPHYVTDLEGLSTQESAYFLSANRNKRSIAVDLAHPQGQALVRNLALKADVVVENFKVGGLAKHGLAYDDLKTANPGLIYCSITGFGQTGPYAQNAGYDFQIQAMGGLMSLTGEAADTPMKTGVAISDIMCGMYASSAILAALHHKTATGQGQYIDLGLLDCQVAWLANQGLNYLTSGVAPARLGNAHPNIVPYQVMASSDGYFVLAVGNDDQFARFCDFAGLHHLASDARYATNNARVNNRAALMSLIEAATRKHPTRYWLEGLEPRHVPCGPVNDVAQVFADPQVKHRGLEIELPHAPAGGKAVKMIANPIKMSATPAQHARSAPGLGEHTSEVLGEWLSLSADDIEKLGQAGAFGV
ncbi:MAG: CoA transferase [Rhodospirillales bacterium]|nr:CoA transferase [Rhodospirillales bacterium]